MHAIRRSITLAATILLAATQAHAGQIPQPLRGSWGDNGRCGPNDPVLTLDANQVRMRSNPTSRIAATVDASGDPANGVALKFLSIDPPHPGGLQVGDTLVIALDQNRLKPVKVVISGKEDTPPPNTFMLRCPG